MLKTGIHIQPALFKHGLPFHNVWQYLKQSVHRNENLIFMTVGILLLILIFLYCFLHTSRHDIFAPDIYNYQSYAMYFYPA